MTIGLIRRPGLISGPGYSRLMPPSGEWSGRAFWRTCGPRRLRRHLSLTWLLLRVVWMKKGCACPAPSGSSVVSTAFRGLLLADVASGRHETELLSSGILFGWTKAGNWTRYRAVMTIMNGGARSLVPNGGVTSG